MIPLKPRPKAAATANKPASSWVSRKPVIVTIWHAEPAITVRNPPTRSAINPQSCRPMNPKASNTDNIALPRVTGMPRSLQKTGTQDQYFVALQLGARAPRQDGAVRQWARGLRRRITAVSCNSRTGCRRSRCTEVSITMSGGARSRDAVGAFRGARLSPRNRPQYQTPPPSRC